MQIIRVSGVGSPGYEQSCGAGRDVKGDSKVHRQTAKNARIKEVTLGAPLC